MADFDYGKYLSSLLIIQYSGKPKAKATVEALAKMFPDKLIMEVRDAFDLDTATGKSLDILAKYLGVNRQYRALNGEAQNLSDDEFRMLIKFKALSNTSNASHYDVDTALYNFFGTRVRATSAGNMEMTIFIPSDAENVIIAAIQQRAMPTPLGVEANRIVIQSKKFFGLVTYEDQFAEYKTGFRDYSDPDKDGETLNYEKVEEVER